MREKLFLLACAFFVFHPLLQANTISTQTAQTLALNFYKLNVPGAGNVTASLSYTKTESDGVIDFYAFDILPVKGFVIVSANDNALPVIAWSKETLFNPNATQNGLADWMKSTAQKLHYAAVNNIPASADITYKWTAFLNGQNPVNSRAVSVGPLCTTTWNQEPYYNALCPFDTAQNQRAVTGCVATTMAQIMKYWNYPAQGTGSNSYNDAPPAYTNSYGVQSASFVGPYNWAAMPNAVSSNTSPVDTLMYICGVSVNMDYGDDLQNGSGAFVLQSEAGPGGHCAQYSYANYFYYNPNTLSGVKLSQYSTADWINLMENELNSGRVIQYEGDDPTSGGHTWVCDGYETNGMLHMNWGWGGASNGYYAVGALTAGGYTFSQNDGALIGIEPLLPITLSITSSSPSICPGGNTTLTANGPAGATYSWTPATGLSCTTCQSPVANPATTTLYKVTADSAGVQASTSMAVVITQPVVAGFSHVGTPSCELPERVSFNNTTTNGTKYFWNFGDGASDSTTAPLHGYNSQGVYTVKLYAYNGCGLDSITQSVTVTGGPPVAADTNTCGGQSVTLHASGVGQIGWFNAQVSGSELTTGPNYTTPVINNTTTYYIGANITAAVVALGPASNTVATGTYYTRTTKRGLIFNNLVSQKLISVDVYADSAGVRTLLLQDSLGNTLDSTSVNILTGHHTLTLNWQLPVGNKLSLCAQGFEYLYRSTTGIVFPYTTTDGSISITGSTSGGFSSSYYFFYNWKLQQSACTTVRVPVTVFVLNSGGGSFTATGTGTPLVNFTPADAAATTYSWDFGDGATSSLMSPSHTYASNGTYTVQLVVSNGTCADTITQTISTTQLGISNVSAFSNLSVFPNPAKEQLNVTVNSNQAINDCRVIIRNILGETIYSSDVDLGYGINNLRFNVASFASGVYVVSLQSGKETLNMKFVKTNE